MKTDRLGRGISDYVGDYIGEIPWWFLGQPEIRCDNEGWGQWERKALQALFKDSYDTNRHFRYGNWAVHLNGGPQASGESWASISIPVNELKVSDLRKIEYTWYNHVTGTAHIGYLGPNLVWSAYDPDDHSKRVDFNTRVQETIAVNPAAGWHEYLLTNSDVTEHVFWYGNNTGTHDTAPAEGAETDFWSAYITDVVFKNWVIYRVQIMTGFWGSTRSTGDVWIGGVKINGVPAIWQPTEAEKIEIDRQTANMFGEATLIANNNASANWTQGGVSPLDQKSSTGWLANLYGGVQTGDDWARVNIPVNEMRVPDLKTAMWTYYMSAAETMGVNMVIWVHDPFNPDYRAEITQLANIATLEKANAWNKHVLDPSVNQFFYYGEVPANISNLTSSVASLYGWDDYVADEMFNTWTIYRITFEYGWEASGTFDDAWVADININGQLIPLKPDSGGSGRIARRYNEATTGAVSFTIAPKTPFRLLSMSVHASAALKTGELLTIIKNCGLGTDTWGDAVIFSDDLFIGTRTSLFVPFGEGYDFPAEDELNVTQPNSEDKDLSIIAMYQTVFA